MIFTEGSCFRKCPRRSLCDIACGSDAKNDNKFVVFYGLVLSGLSDIACGSEPKNDTQVSFF
ncbi:hypothetical protein KJ870_00075 [bacterium]|nr:hypothetical protein [bacterium]MBU1433329.1 hypothetical protein [bacterium]MBU1503443.1 hypothetical protein [bacterium]